LLVGTTTIADSGRIAAKQPSGGGWVHEVVHEGSTQYFMNFRDASGSVGSISSSGGTTVYATTSDYRLKENVVEMTGAINRVKELKPSQFNFIAYPNKTVDGFLAHETQAVVPEAVTGEKDGEAMQGIDQSKLVPLLTGALKEAITRIETLEAEVAALKAN